MGLIKETFSNFESLLTTINNRPENRVMAGKNSSHDNDYDFYRTNTYEEAVFLLRNGYTEILPRIKNSLGEEERRLSKLYLVPRSVPFSTVVGYVPNIPNAIMNLPNSMINTNREPRKQKTVSIMYFISANCNRDTDFFINAGVALVSAINILERYGIQTKLTIAFEGAYRSSQAVISDVCIKNFGQRFNLQKICFPLAHPSMFRRIGFRYLETCPGLTEEGFRVGYGRAFETEDDIKEWFTPPKDTHIITSEWIHAHNNDPVKILERLGLI